MVYSLLPQDQPKKKIQQKYQRIRGFKPQTQWTDLMVMYFFAGRGTLRCESHGHPYSRAFRGEAISMSLSYLPPPACMVTLQDAGQTIHVCLSPSSTRSHLLRHRDICIFWRAASDHAQGCTCRFTICPDGKPNLESNLRPPFQRRRIPANTLRQKLLQFWVCLSLQGRNPANTPSCFLLQVAF